MVLHSFGNESRVLAGMPNFRSLAVKTQQNCGSPVRDEMRKWTFTRNILRLDFPQFRFHTRVLASSPAVPHSHIEYSVTWSSAVPLPHKEYTVTYNININMHCNCEELTACQTCLLLHMYIFWSAYLVFWSCMDGWVRVLRPFNSISVIWRRWKGEHERLCAMKRRLGSGRISPPAGFEPVTPWSEVGSANRSATRTLQYSGVSK